MSYRVLIMKETGQARAHSGEHVLVAVTCASPARFLIRGTTRRLDGWVTRIPRYYLVRPLTPHHTPFFQYFITSQDSEAS